MEALLKYSRWRKLCEKSTHFAAKKYRLCHSSSTVEFNLSIGLMKFSEKLRLERMVGDQKELAFILWEIGNLLRFLSCECSVQSCASGTLTWQGKV